MRDFTVAVVLPAAGSGSRLGADRPKAFVELCGVPLWRRSLDVFLAIPCVRQVLIPIGSDGPFGAMRESLRSTPETAGLLGERVFFEHGGATRALSVAGGIRSVKRCDLIAVHDAARPLVSRNEVETVFAAAAEHGAAILASSVTGTIKRVRDGLVAETVPRDDLWEAQTPQVARADLMRQAYAPFIEALRDGRGGDPIPSATDESSLLERIGVPVAVVKGSARNFKITTPADFALAEALLRADSREPGAPMPDGPLKLPCPECGSVLKLPNRSVLGKVGKCPGCGHRFTLEEPADDAVPLELAEPAAPAFPDLTKPKPAPRPPTDDAGPAPAAEGSGFDFAAAEPQAGVLKQRRRSKRRKRTPEIVVGVLSALAVGYAGWELYPRFAGGRPAPRQATVEVREERAAAKAQQLSGYAAAMPGAEPIPLRAMPAGVSLLVHLRPAELWSDRWAAVRQATGPLARGRRGRWRD